ncbi:MAG: HXXEE domain-containing protein [Chloroflexi bacterium]|nr:HXXEE domain-containing protein [Chloroflexota bacterium]
MILPVKIETLMWLLPIVFMFHDFEEIIMFKPWLDANRENLERRFPKWAARALAEQSKMSTSAFAFAVAEEFIVLSALTLLAVELELYPFWVGMMLGFFIHLLVHMGQFIVYRKYVPVILTSLPSGIYCLVALHDLNLQHPLDWELVAIWTLLSLIIIGANLALALKLAAKFGMWLERNFPERN